RGDLVVVGVRRDGRPDVAFEDLLASDLGQAMEHATTVGELAVRRLLHGAVAAAGEVLAPLPGLRVVEEQRHALEVAAGSRGFDLLDVGAPVPQGLVDHGSVEFGPCADARCGDVPTLDVGTPGAEMEVEGVLLVDTL